MIALALGLVFLSAVLLALFADWRIRKRGKGWV